MTSYGPGTFVPSMKGPPTSFAAPTTAGPSPIAAGVTLTNSPTSAASLLPLGTGAAAAAGASSGDAAAASGRGYGGHVVVHEARRKGWIEKYSVGRGMLPLRNWQRRWFTIDNHGLNYAKSNFEAPQRRTYVPFVSMSTSRDVTMLPVFLYPHVTEQIHPAATDSALFYFALRFEENRTPRVLLLRCATAEERASWVRFLSQFVHAASLLTGVPLAHPLSGYKRGYDPDELDAKEKKTLRQAVLEWDEGSHLRGAPGAACPDPVIESERQLDLRDVPVWGDSDAEDGGGIGGAGVATARGSGLASPGRGTGLGALDTPPDSFL